ncbi:hypothetical protein H310_06993 [Aphanomyces invadans]|uniref:Uncharacterized protein n=1 Tax=Aphanomyces invadans TaxID=157072 RepID=A0A024U2A8_9STRA|nr:hypothetical protein H310_06993 [Aphanomyces invadans]ETW00345.1 hypothetical protein H310_06993 [Aphanomyces invadans]|eukprot:XP_008870480.1 hypothetical protein H310_06993 [Aphanomyces invadans]
MDQRSTLREISAACGLSLGTLSRNLKKGTLQRRTTRIKPLLNDTNKAERFPFSNASASVDFDNLWDVVHLDEK